MLGDLESERHGTRLRARSSQLGGQDGFKNRPNSATTCSRPSGLLPKPSRHWTSARLNLTISSKRSKRRRRTSGIGKQSLTTSSRRSKTDLPRSMRARPRSNSERPPADRPPVDRPAVPQAPAVPRAVRVPRVARRVSTTRTATLPGPPGLRLSAVAIRDTRLISTAITTASAANDEER